MKSRGFTLIEIVIAMAILATVLFSISTFVFHTAMDLREVTRWAREGREGPAIMAQMERDFASAYVDARMKEMFSAVGSASGSEIRFVTSRNSVLFLNGVQSDLTEVGYRLESNDEKGTLPLHTLYRREEFLLDDEPLTGGLWIPVADNIVSLEMFFYELPEEDKSTGQPVAMPDLTFAATLGSGVEELEEWSDEDRFLPFLVKIVLKIDIRDSVDRDNAGMEEKGIQTFTSLVRMPAFPRNLPEGKDDLVIALNDKKASGGNDKNNGGGDGGNSGGNGHGK